MNAAITKLLGISCETLSEAGKVAAITTPFTFEDGDPLPVFVETLAGKIRFFDAGGLVLHLLGRGIQLDDHAATQFIKTLVSPCDVVLTEEGELEAWADTEEAPIAFARFMSAMLTLVRWEHEYVDTVWFELTT